jgi:hypothetical protein
VSLQIIQLHKLLPRERDIRKHLGKLPKSLNTAYNEIYAQVQAQEGSAPEIANRAFQWVMCSYIPLSSAELVAAVCQDPETDTVDPVDIDINVILVACNNLLVVDQRSGVCQFSHLSVQEYFENHHWNQSQANGLIAKVCLSLLNDPILQKLDPQSANEDTCIAAALAQRASFEIVIQEQQDRNDGIMNIVRYASLHWAIHIQRYGEEIIDERLAKLLKQFLGSMNESGPAYKSWHRIFKELSADMHDDHVLLRDKLVPTSLASFAICAYGFHKILSD